MKDRNSVRLKLADRDKDFDLTLEMQATGELVESEQQSPQAE